MKYRWGTKSLKQNSGTNLCQIQSSSSSKVFTVITFGSRWTDRRTSTASLAEDIKSAKQIGTGNFRQLLSFFCAICISHYDGSNWTWRTIKWHVDAGCNGPLIDFLQRNIAILSYFNGCRTRCIHDYTNKPRRYILCTVDSRASD